VRVADGQQPVRERRPRDELGRPLPRHERNRLPLEDFDRLSTAENNRLAMGYFTAGQYFGAHEAWESCWKQTAATADAEVFKGLAQLAAGYVHLQRGNPHGCCVLLRRAIGRLRGSPADWQGFALVRMIADAQHVIASQKSPVAGASRDDRLPGENPAQPAQRGTGDMQA
jgi:hypothetical protein